MNLFYKKNKALYTVKKPKYGSQFNYLYRDASNYKQYGSVIFSNPNSLSAKEIDKIFRRRLIDEMYFDHITLDIPSLFFNDRNEHDHDWHEYENTEITDENPSDRRTIEEFLIGIGKN